MWFALDSNNVRRIGFERADFVLEGENQTIEENKEEKEFVLVLKGGWKCIKY